MLYKHNIIFDFALVDLGYKFQVKLELELYKLLNMMQLK